MSGYNLVSFAGIFVLLGVAWLCSAQRRNLNWRAIGWGVALQLLLGLCVFVMPPGRAAFLWLNDVVVRVLAYANEGTKFVFGPLATAKGSDDFILAFQALPTIIFFSALMALLYYVRLLPLLVRWFARVFTRLLRLSGAESLSVASNTFVGVEAAFVIRPHLRELTPSEYCTVLAAGMATVSSNVLALYVGFLGQEFPTIAGHLISATLIAIPAAVVLAKIILPEDGHPLTLGRDVAPHDERDASLFGAVVRGAQEGLQVVLGIVAVLIAVVGLVSLANGLLGWAGQTVGGWCGTPWAWSLEGLLAGVFYPFTVILGIPLEDASICARLIGERLVLTEVRSYLDLKAAIASPGLQPRSVLITTYALCGFAHLASLGIFVGGTAALVPERTGVIAKVGPRALLAATLACLMTACVAGTFVHDQTPILAAAPAAR